jgi:hypothetical protein
MNKLKKMESSEVSAYFPKLGKRYATLKISDCLMHPQIGKSEHPVSIITFNVKSEELVPLLNDVVKTSANILGLIKLFMKYIIMGKIKLGGSLFKAITIIETIMIGSHPMYKQEKELLKENTEENK